MKLGDSHLQTIKTLYKAIVMKTVWYWHKNRNIDQWNRYENSEKNPIHLDQPISDGRKEWSFKQMVLGQLDVHMQKN